LIPLVVLLALSDDYFLDDLLEVMLVREHDIVLDRTSIISSYAG